MALLALVALSLAGCGGDDDQSSGDSDEGATTTTEPATEDLTVRVVAEQSGLSGCVASTRQSGLDVGVDSRLTVTDEDGSTVGTGTFALSPGLTPGVDICDWTAEVPDVEAGSDFYTLEVGGGTLATVSIEELATAPQMWHVTVEIDATGRVTVQ